MQQPPEVERQLQFHDRADARFASTMIAMVIGAIRRGEPLDGERLAQLADMHINSDYSTDDPTVAEGLRGRGEMLRKLYRKDLTKP